MTQSAKDAGFGNDPYAASFPENTPFWQAAAQGRLLVKACKACGKVHWYPRLVCPFCASDDLEWRPASGGATVHAFSVMRRVDKPYVVAYVTLDEGPTMLTNIVDCPVDSVSLGQRVQVCFAPAPEGRAMPFFRPADAQRSA